MLEGLGAEGYWREKRELDFCDVQRDDMETVVTKNEIKTYKPEGNSSSSNSQSHKYPDDFINKIICGDCLELIRSIPDKKIDCVITDPPYGLNKNGIKNDKDLSLFYNILPDCYRVLKDDSYFITFFSTKYLPDIFKNNPFTYF